MHTLTFQLVNVCFVDILFVSQHRVEERVDDVMLSGKTTTDTHKQTAYVYPIAVDYEKLSAKIK